MINSELTRKEILQKRKIKLSRAIKRNIAFGFIVILLSLGGGVFGYSHFEQMSLVDAYVNAAMILSGMGPVSTLNTVGGKIFAGSYALFSGIIFLFVMALILSPLFHFFLQFFHVDEKDN